MYLRQCYFIYVCLKDEMIFCQKFIIFIRIKFVFFPFLTYPLPQMKTNVIGNKQEMFRDVIWCGSLGDGVCSAKHWTIKKKGFLSNGVWNIRTIMAIHSNCPITAFINNINKVNIRTWDFYELQFDKFYYQIIRFFFK